MITRMDRAFAWPLLFGGLLALSSLTALSPARAQETGYRTTESTIASAEADHDTAAADNKADSDAAAPNKGVGPVRLARFAFVSGNVTWRADDTAEWAQASINTPIRQDAQVWVTNGGRASVQFDDGSELRLGNGALITLKVMFSDAQGEYTQITLTNGLATLYSRHDNSVYQIDTPSVSIRAKSATQVRVGIDNGSEVVVQRGEATLESTSGTKSLHSGEYAYLADTNDPISIRRAPRPDEWDRWNDDRNAVTEGSPEKHVPSNIGLVSGELDRYGSWRNDTKYGWVWCPRVSEPEWRPYYYGHWTWVDPFGWTWVSDEPWGWAPYHYGSWVRLSYGWGWCPGPLYQYWSPAVVHFSVYNDCVAWAPLCPWEIRYPGYAAFGYWGRGWGLSFSIGCAGVYYAYDGYCAGRPWNSHYINHWRYRDHDRFRDFDRRGPSYDRFRRTAEFAASNGRFVPYNGTRVAGAAFARVDSFGNRNAVRGLAQSQSAYFTRGRIAAPASGGVPVAGPGRVEPTASSLARGGASAASAISPSRSLLGRSAYQAPLPGAVQRDVVQRGAADRAGIGGVSRSFGQSAGTARTPGADLRSRPNGSVSTGDRSAPVGSGRPTGDRFTGIGAGRSTGPGDRTGSFSPAEQAQRARASLGMTGSARSYGPSQAGGSRGDSGAYSGSAAGRTPGAGNRSYDRSSSDQPVYRSQGGSYRGDAGGGYNPGSSRSYGGGYSGGGSSGGGRSYGGGYSGGGSSGGGRSYGGGYSGGGSSGGGHSSGGSGGRGSGGRGSR